jgi:hypothetical protein
LNEVATMLGRWLCLGFCAVPIAAIAQQKPVFDPLNPPETAVVEPQRTEHAAGLMPKRTDIEDRPDHRRRPDRDRPGLRVRLFRRAGL